MAQVSFKLIQFRDKLKLPEEAKDIPDALLAMALTHPSGVKDIPREYTREAKKWDIHNYEYPEFIGDAILDVICVIAIHNLSDPSVRTPHTSTRLKQGLVKNSHLACIMDSRKLCNLIILGSTQDYEPKMCADIFEAVVGVLYIYMQPIYGYNSIKILYNWIMKDWNFKDDLDILAKGEEGECTTRIELQTTGQKLKGARLAKYRKEIGTEIEEGIKDQIRAEYEAKFNREFDVIREKYFLEQQIEKQRLEEELIAHVESLEKEYAEQLQEKTERLKELSSSDLKLQISALQRELSSRVKDESSPSPSRASDNKIRKSSSRVKDESSPSRVPRATSTSANKIRKSSSRVRDESSPRPSPSRAMGTSDNKIIKLSNLYTKYNIANRPFFISLESKNDKVAMGILCPNSLDRCLDTPYSKNIIGAGEGYNKDDAKQRAAGNAIMFLEDEIIPELDAIKQMLDDSYNLLDRYPDIEADDKRTPKKILASLFIAEKVSPKSIESYNIKDKFTKVVGILRPDGIRDKFATIHNKDIIGIGTGHTLKAAEINALKVAVVFLKSEQEKPITNDLLDLLEESNEMIGRYDSLLDEKERTYNSGIVLVNIYQKKRIPRSIVTHTFNSSDGQIIIGIVKPEQLEESFAAVDGIDIIGLGSGNNKTLAKANAVKSAVVFIKEL